MLEKYSRYISDVISGKTVTGKLARFAVERQLKDLARQGKDDFPYYFDEDSANIVLVFFSMLRHTKGKWGGQRFNLEDNQAFLLAVLFGWKRKRDDKRRFRKAYVEVARKNGKSEIAAGILLYMALMDGEKVGENYSAATTRDQAKIVFKSAKIMAEYLVKDSETMKRRIKIYQHSILDAETGSTIHALSSEAGTLDGLNPHGSIVDEYHEHKTSDVLGVIQTGTGSREQPLIFIITTAGFNQASPCYTEERKVAVDILESITADESLFTIIYTLDSPEEWDKRECWPKANPNIGRTPTYEYMEAAVLEAKNKGGQQLTQVLTKNMNIWTDAPEVWISTEDWVKNEGAYSESDLNGRMCFGGLDLASVSDTTAFCLYFPPDSTTTKHIFKWWLWLPEDAVEKRAGKVNYPLWVQQGWIRTVPGNAMEYHYVRAEMNTAAKMYDIKAVNFDRWNSSQIVPELIDDGFNMTPTGQGHASMASPCREFERLMLSGQCLTGGNPVAKWQNGNVVIDYNPAGDMKPNKDKSTEKIDAIVAALMALYAYQQYLSQQKPVSSYLLEEDTELIRI